MAKLGEGVTPTGQKVDIFDIGSWLGQIKGVFMLLASLAIGQFIFQKAGSTKLARQVGADSIEPFTNLTKEEKAMPVV